MNKRTQFAWLISIVAMGTVWNSCTIDEFDQDRLVLTTEEAVIAGQIIGESVSENQNGLLSSFSEAFAVPTESKLIVGPSMMSSSSFRGLDEYSYTFDPDSGKHQVTFTKEKENQLFMTLSSYTLIYTFFDSNGNVIENPANRMSHIDAVEYVAERNGEIIADSKISYFQRSDQLFIDGLSGQSEVITIDGYHSGEGTFTKIKTGGNRIEREYLLDINYLDIHIDKSVVQSNRNFRAGVTGAFSYESAVRQTGGVNPDTKTINGTIELNGDGTALLKFQDQFDDFRLRLDDGEVFDDDEFEGRVRRVNLDENIITIANGQRIQITDETEFESGDFNNLKQVSVAVETGVRVYVEGEYYHPDENVNLWIATEVEFELESNEFEDWVASVNNHDNSFTLENGDRFFITGSSEVEFEDGLKSLADVNGVINLGVPVEAEGEFYVDVSTGNRVVKEVEFEPDFDGFEEFDEDVVYVSVEESYFTLETGENVKIVEETIIDDDGDFFTLEEIARVLDNGEEVEAEGSYFFDQNTGFWIAVIVEFSD